MEMIKLGCCSKHHFISDSYKIQLKLRLKMKNESALTLFGFGTFLRALDSISNNVFWVIQTKFNHVIWWGLGNFWKKYNFRAKYRKPIFYRPFYTYRTNVDTIINIILTMINNICFGFLKYRRFYFSNIRKILQIVGSKPTTSGITLLLMNGGRR